METKCWFLMPKSNHDPSSALANQMDHLSIKSLTLHPVRVVAVDSSESSGESVSGFSSSGNSFHSAPAGEAEDASSVCSSTVTLKEVAEAVEALTAGDFPAGANSAVASPEKLQPAVSSTAELQCPVREICSEQVRWTMKWF